MAAKLKYWIRDADGEEVYAKILELCAAHCRTYSVVINRRALPSRAAFDFVEEIRPFIVCDEQQTSWPGGGVLEPSATARVLHVLVGSESIALLKKAAAGLYDWVHPFLPEDLAFYRPDKSVFFAVIGHEGVSFFEINPDEENHVRSKLPELDLLTSSPI